MPLKPLGRRVPTDDKHIRKYSLNLKETPISKPTPVTCGINWYENFDTPEQDANGLWWIGKNKNDLGNLRGGHCIAMPFDFKRDLKSWYLYYDQGEEGACVGFGSSRMMSLLNRKMYDARWLWNEAKKIDEWPDTNPGDDQGTSVRAAFDVLRAQGHERKKGKHPILADGISENRWATNVDDLFTVLQNEQYKKLGAIPFLNSWGSYYPRVTWMPCETWDRLIREDGEFTMSVDREKGGAL